MKIEEEGKEWKIEFAVPQNTTGIASNTHFEWLGSPEKQQKIEALNWLIVSNVHFHCFLQKALVGAHLISGTHWQQPQWAEKQCQHAFHPFLKNTPKDKTPRWCPVKAKYTFSHLLFPDSTLPCPHPSAKRTWKSKSVKNNAYAVHMLNRPITTAWLTAQTNFIGFQADLNQSEANIFRKHLEKETRSKFRGKGLLLASKQWSSSRLRPPWAKAAYVHAHPYIPLPSTGWMPISAAGGPTQQPQLCRPVPGVRWHFSEHGTNKQV